MTKVALILSVIALTLMPFALALSPFQEEEIVPVDNGCLVDYTILMPYSAMDAGQVLVAVTDMPQQFVEAAGFLQMGDRQFYFVDGQWDYAIGEICWQGDHLNPTPTFLDPIIINKPILADWE